MGGEFQESQGIRFCSVCGYEERDVYRLFCPQCLRRDRLSVLRTATDPPSVLSLPPDPSAGEDGTGTIV